MTETPRFSPEVLQELAVGRILGVRAGERHRFTGVWMVVLDDRLFVRSWNNAPSGWYRAFRAEPRGVIQIGERQIEVDARRTRSAALRKKVSAAYAKKYPTKASERWVRGFAESERELTTVELVPEGTGRRSS